MATKSEIKEWLECCGAGARGFLVFRDKIGRGVWCFYNRDKLGDRLGSHDAAPLHLLNHSLTGIQGPTFAEWKKQKGREGKVEKVLKLPSGLIPESYQLTPVQIRCPECRSICDAAVVKTDCGAKYFHICEHCSEIITASEWERVNESE